MALTAATALPCGESSITLGTLDLSSASCDASDCCELDCSDWLEPAFKLALDEHPANDSGSAMAHSAAAQRAK
ncbi:hypothetical protein DW066_02970 [Bifidobacterium pseudocatenulatum]|nr:hypothetical protein DW066_02970 [Bifidobacterium pseudocatenulatum]